jgi:Tfp pilus assembly protein PilW
VQRHSKNFHRCEEGFSLLELLIGMTVTLVILGIASTLLATSFNVRNREHSRTDSIADVQRALNIMSREIAIGGYGFDSANNGLVAGDCDGSTIRVRSNLNRFSADSNSIDGLGEDVKYLVDSTDGQDYLVRYDIATNQSTVLANRINTLEIIYWSADNTELDITDPSQVTNAVGIRLTLTATLAEVGSPGAPGYHPETPLRLTSDVALRNKGQNLSTY